MRKIALIPVYNEEATLLRVLDAVGPRVDRLLVVDDGSVDRSLELARDWARRNTHTRVLSLQRNQGMSAALREGFRTVVDLLRRGELDADDLLFTLDADGQHDPGRIDALARYIVERRLDVALTRRDFSAYPRYKRLGNRWMSLWGSIWSGFPYEDIESGFRGLRLRVLPRLLEYYKGHRYSCAQEIAILTARLGFHVDNTFPAPVALYRSQTRLRDVAINAAFGFWAFARWALDLKVAPLPQRAQAVSPESL